MLIREEVIRSRASCIHEGATSLIFRLQESELEVPAVIKVPRAAAPRVRERLRLLNEYQILRDIRVSGVRRALQMRTLDGRPALVLEYVEGTTLREAFSGRGGLAEKIAVGASIAGALASLHGRGIVHHNLSATNILVGPDLRAATLIDLALASRGGAQPGDGSSRVIEGTLAYLSPELTGRMNRAVDFRSDLYSLGVVLYELLAERLPFQARDPAELVHSHIAREPALLHAVRPEVPAPLSAVVMKLLAKDPSDRYQSAFGVKADLEVCLHQLEAGGPAAGFELAQEDLSEVFRIPERPFGREAQRTALAEALASAEGGAGRVVLLSGPAGVGKSFLARELHHRVAGRKGYFLVGRGDERRRNVPYDAILQALSELLTLLLTESPERLAEWRLGEALGADAAPLCEALPQLRLVLGEAAPPEPGQRSLLEGLVALVEAVGRCRRPLVLFLDNLHWADPASLALLGSLCGEVQRLPLLVVGAFRCEDLHPRHPLREMLGTLGRCSAASVLTLDGFSREALEALVAEALHCGAASARPFSEAVYEKSGGNPLFAIDFLRALHERGTVRFDPEGARWRWDLEAVRRLRSSDSVAALASQELHGLPKPARDLLCIAGCLGSVFDVEDLSALAGLSVEEVFCALGQALDRGLVVRASTGPGEAAGRSFAFAHNRFRRATEALLPRRERKRLHLEIGRRLLERTAEGRLPEMAFTIADHLNEGFSYVTSDRERLRLVEINLMAGRRAKREGAVEAALWYLSMGVGLLPSQRWSLCPDLALQVLSEALEVEQASADFERATLLADELLPRAAGARRRAALLARKVSLLAAQRRSSEALKAGLEALRLLDLELPTGAEGIAARTRELRAELAVLGGHIEDLATERPLSQEPPAALEVLRKMVWPARQVDPPLFALIVCTMAARSAGAGSPATSAFAYAWYGALLCERYGDVEQGYRFGRLALGFIERQPASEDAAAVRLVFDLFIRPWKEPAREAVRSLDEISKTSRGTMAVPGGAAQEAAAHLCGQMLSVGAPLEQVRQRLSEHLESFGRLRLELPRQLESVWASAVSRLAGGPISPAAEASVTPASPAAFYAACWELIACYSAGQTVKAMAAGRSAERLQTGLEAALYQVDRAFYQALALLKRCGEAPDERDACLQEASALEVSLAGWAKLAPANFEPKLALVQAERARVAGDAGEAMRRYGDALRGARQQGSLRDEALAYECEAAFHLSQEREDIAGACLRKACDGYRAWGAVLKAGALEEEHRDLLAREEPPALDTLAVIKASQALSQELRLDRLLDALMRIVLESAGAVRGVLLVQEGGKLVLRAEGRVGVDPVARLPGLEVETSGRVPVSVVSFVARTRAPVLLADASNDATFGSDPYVAARGVRSVLCSPLIHQGKLSGVIYLENDLATHAFTPSRMELVKALSSQAAISFENAALYARLEESIAGYQRAEAELRESQERYRQLFDSSPVSLWEEDFSGIREALAALRASGIRDFQGYFERHPEDVAGCAARVRILDVNEATIELLGAGDKREVLAKLPRLLLGELSEVFRKILVALAEGRRALAREATIQALDGRWLTVTVCAVVPPGHEGALDRLLMSLLDITGLKRAEERVRQMNAELEQRVRDRTAELETSNKELQAFSYSVSHDLRSPLRSIDGFSQALLESYGRLLEGQGGEYLNKIRAASQRMAGLIDALLSLSRVTRAEMRRVRVDLSARAQSIAGELEARQPNRQVDFVIRPDVVATADPNLVHIVLMNLLENAWKFTSKHETARIEFGVLDPRAESKRGSPVFFVRDDGAGFDPVHAAKLFGPFQRMHATSEFEGTGIGLATVQRIVQRHGGQVWAEAAVEKGASFFFTLGERA